MATRPHRNLHLVDCVGLQFAKDKGNGDLELESVELLVPESKGSISYDDFKKMVFERMDMKAWQVKEVVWRDSVNQRAWHVDTNDTFFILWREQARLNNATIFTVIVTPHPERVKELKAAAEEKKKLEKPAA